ncbi:MAG: DUF222 domain-containing protein, partial [Gammaproteobacteria bacterium]
AAHIHAATYRLLCLIREFDEVEGWGGWGVKSCAHWLNWKCGIGMNAAREKVRVARSLGDLPKIGAAFERGELSYSKVRAMTRVATPDNEDYLLNIARHGTAAHVEGLVRRFQRVSALADANAAHAHRRFSYFTDDDGSLVFHGRLTAEQGALLLKALDAAKDALWADSRRDDPPDVTAETSAESNHGNNRADALSLLAESFLAHGAQASSGGDKYQVVVHVERDHVHLDDGPGVSAETFQRLACDCGVVEVEENEHGQPLNIGRKSRSIPPALRRALIYRDGGCRFPGCTAKRFVDGHHIRHWCDGGETSMENLVLLCRHHHRLVHEGGFGLYRLPDDRLRFATPGGAEIPAAIPLSTPDAQANLPPARSDGAPGWRGERIDWHMAVGQMWELTRPELEPCPPEPPG